MKTLKRILFNFVLLAIALMAAQLIVSTAFAQGTNGLPALPGVSADAAAGAVTALIGALTAKYGWLVTVIAWIGILRAVFKPLMLFIEAVVAATPSKSDDVAVAQFEAGPIYKWLTWGLDWLASVKLSPTANTNPLVK